MRFRSRICLFMTLCSLLGVFGVIGAYALAVKMNLLALALLTISVAFGLYSYVKARQFLLAIERSVSRTEAAANGEPSAPDPAPPHDEIFASFDEALIKLVHKLEAAQGEAKLQKERAQTANDELFMQTTQLEMIVQERTQELDYAQRHTQLILDSLAEGVIEVDPLNRITFANSTILRLLGHEEHSLLGRDFFETLPHNLSEEAERTAQDRQLRQALESLTPQYIAHRWLQTKAGHNVPVAISVAPMMTDDVKTGAVIAFTDLTEMLEANKMIEAIYEYSAEGYVLFREDLSPVDCNPAMVTLLKTADKEEFLRDFTRFCPSHQPSGEDSVSFLQRVLAETNDNSHARFEWVHQDAEGNSIPCLMTLTRIGLPPHLSYIACVYDQSDQKKAEKALTRQREQLQEIIDSSPIAMAIVCDGEIHYQNDNYRDLLGLEIGDHSWRVFVDRERRAAALREVAGGRRVKNAPFQLVTTRGDTLDTLVSFHSFIYEGRASVLTWMTDVTELTRAKELAEEASRVKGDFLASMSHEIRTPMNAIIGMTHLCLQTSLSEKQKNYVEKIQKAAMTLLALINDILDFSKIESGKFTLDKAPFRLSDILHSLSDMVAFKAEEKGLLFKMEVDSSVPPAFFGDGLRLNQILLNLCNNSIKFTERGSISLRISLEKMTFSYGDMQPIARLRFVVEDTGIGMTPEQIEKLFNPFVQADGSITRKYGGSGLGLSICKHLVESMDGEIGVKSTHLEGSVFYFTALMEVAKDEPIETASFRGRKASTDPEEEKSAMEYLRGASVLLVEDNEINQEIALELLSQVGIKAGVAQNGEEAIAMTGTTKYDLVLMDVQMPIMDGLEATRRIRETPLSSPDELPIIAMTAHAMKGDYEKSIASGMNDHITKPIDPAAFYATLRKWLVKTEKRVRRSEEMAAESGLKDMPGVSVSQGLRYVNGNEKLYTMLLKKFPTQFETAVNQIREFIKEGQFVDAARVAHSIKGSGATLGMVELSQVASSLEQAIKAEDDSFNEQMPLFESELNKVLDSVKTL